MNGKRLPRTMPITAAKWSDDCTDRNVGETRDTKDDHRDGGAGRKEQNTDSALLGLIAELAHDARIERHVAKR